MIARIRIALLALLCCPAAACVAADDVREVLDRELPRLGSEEWRVREEAHQAILALGLRAEAAVRAEMEKAEDPEIRARLAAILQSYALDEEENYALERIRKDEPFPACGDAGIRVESGTAAEALESLARDAKIEIGTFPKGASLDALARRTALLFTSTYAGGNAARSALIAIVETLDATFVVDGGRVVVVRLTPNVFFALLEKHLRGRPDDHVEQSLAQFERPIVSHWESIMHFLQQKVTKGSLSRDKWFYLLADRAACEGEKEKNRVLALRALRYFLGITDRIQEDVEEAFLRAAFDAKAPESVRHAAYSGLAMGLTAKSQDAVLEILEKGTDPERRAMLMAVQRGQGLMYSAATRIDADPARRERLEKSLSAIASGPGDETDLPALALAVRVLRGDGSAFEALCEEPIPEARDALGIHLRALIQPRLSSGAIPENPKRMERIGEAAKHGSPEVRAMTAAFLGYSAGGADRLPDVDACLVLLDDPAPIVRNFAARALATIYSAHASKPFRERLDEVRERLGRKLESETDDRVKRCLRESLDGMLR